MLSLILSPAFGSTSAWSQFYAVYTGYQFDNGSLLKTAVVVFKCFRGHALLYLTELCRPISSDAGHHHLHTAFTHRMIVPCTKTSYCDRSFSVHVPSVWNSLPNDLRLTDMLLGLSWKPFCLDIDYPTAHLLLGANLGYINSIIIIIITEMLLFCMYSSL